jgi:hypothetical protein
MEFSDLITLLFLLSRIRRGAYSVFMAESSQAYEFYWLCRYRRDIKL